MKAPNIVGLTGGIGSGKSAATDAFAKLGIDIVDADVVARDVVKPNTPGLHAIVNYFGNDILLNEGTLDRSALRERVFNNPEDKTWLNNTLHPLIREEMQRQLEQTTTPYCIFAVPLLVENKLTELCDRVVVIDCPESLQIERATARDGSSQQTIENIMASQASRDQRKRFADDVVDNSGTLDALNVKINTLHKQYLARYC